MIELAQGAKKAFLRTLVALGGTLIVEKPSIGRHLMNSINQRNVNLDLREGLLYLNNISLVFLFSLWGKGGKGL